MASDTFQSKNNVTEISKDQFYQILGLVTAKIELDRQIQSLHNAYCSITKIEDDGRFWDWSIGDEIGLAQDIKKKLKFDGIIIKEKKNEN